MQYNWIIDLCLLLQNNTPHEQDLVCVKQEVLSSIISKQVSCISTVMKDGFQQWIGCFMGGFCPQVVQNQTFSVCACFLLSVHTQWMYEVWLKFCWNFAKINLVMCEEWKVGALFLFSSYWHSLQSMKTSVCSILNSSLTDVFIFCNKSLSDNIKRVQTSVLQVMVEFFTRTGRNCTCSL